MRLFKSSKKKAKLHEARRSHLTDEKGKGENNEALSQLTLDELPRIDLEEPEDLSESTMETLEETSENKNATKGYKKKKQITGISLKKDKS